MSELVSLLLNLFMRPWVGFDGNAMSNEWGALLHLHVHHAVHPFCSVAADWRWQHNIIMTSSCSLRVSYQGRVRKTAKNGGKLFFLSPSRTMKVRTFNSAMKWWLESSKMSLTIIAGSLKILMLEAISLHLWKHCLSLSILQLQQRNITFYMLHFTWSTTHHTSLSISAHGNSTFFVECIPM